MIARSADFYGPNTRNGVPNLLVFEPFSRKLKASWLVNDSVPHSYTYTPDAAQSLVQLAEQETAWNQTWHVPTTPNPPTGKEFGFAGTPYADGIRTTAASFKRDAHRA